MDIRTPIPAISVLRGGLPMKGHERTVEDDMFAFLGRSGTHYMVPHVTIYRCRRSPSGLVNGVRNGHAEKWPPWPIIPPTKVRVIRTIISTYVQSLLIGKKDS